MARTYKTHESSVVHENPWFKVTKDRITKPNNEEGEFFIVNPSPGVVIVPVNNKHEVILVKLFRYTTRNDSLEVPAGGTDGDEPLVAAKRELQEETGLVAGDWTHIGHFQMANGMSDQWSDIYLAQDLSVTPTNDQAEEGIEEIISVPFNAAIQMIKDGHITDIASVAALCLANTHIKT